MIQLGLGFLVVSAIAYYFYRQHREGQAGFYSNRTPSRPNEGQAGFYSNRTPSRPNGTNVLADFYSNRIPSRPYGQYIDVILSSWYGNYDFLEKKTDYMQWLFPNRQRGLNNEAPLLTDENAKIIRETPELKKRMKAAFEMMLNFYGMKLVDNQFQLANNHVERLRVLNQCRNHNFQRITRILLALKECGHDNLMLPWLKFLSGLIYQSECLNEAQSSFMDHWTKTLDRMGRIELERFLQNN